jgi:hypothetical protein
VGHCVAGEIFEWPHLRVCGVSSASVKQTRHAAAVQYTRGASQSGVREADSASTTSTAACQCPRRIPRKAKRGALKPALVGSRGVLVHAWLWTRV